MNPHQPNGNAPLVNGLPSSGQQTDMTYLWTVIQQLSEALAENRAQNTSVLNGVHQLQARVGTENGVHVNGDTNGVNIAAQKAALETENSQLRNTNALLSAELESCTGLLDDYENSLRVILDKLRPWAQQNQKAILANHQHYQTLLEQERQEKLDQSLEQFRWQEGLGKVTEYARAALRAKNEVELADVNKIAELKNENRILRRLAGWQTLDDSDEEEDLEKRVATEQQSSGSAHQT